SGPLAVVQPAVLEDHGAVAAVDGTGEAFGRHVPATVGAARGQQFGDAGPFERAAEGLADGRPGQCRAAGGFVVDALVPSGDLELRGDLGTGGRAGVGRLRHAGILWSAAGGGLGDSRPATV